LQTTYSVLEQKEKDFQKQKAEVLCPGHLCNDSVWSRTLMEARVSYVVVEVLI